MSTTTFAGLRYPTSAVSPNVPQDIQNLATDLDQAVVVRVPDTATRNALSSKYDGMRVYEVSSQRTFRWNTAPTTPRWDNLDGPWYSWTPSLTTTAGVAVTASPLTASGSYVIREGRIRFNAAFRFQGGIDGKSGALVVQMPSGVVSKAAEPTQDNCTCTLFSPGSGRWIGVGAVGLSGTVVGPTFPAGTGVTMSAFINATGPGATGTGTPLVSGSFPLVDGSRLAVWGEYELSSWPAL